MLNWVKCSERMPDDPNSIKNECLIKTKYGQYMFAGWSIHLKMWRRIAVPYHFNVKEVIDELLEPEDVVAWVNINEIKYEDKV